MTIVFLTGAGISVASGIRPYRGVNGLWNEQTPEECFSTKATRDTNPTEAFNSHLKWAEQCASASPNQAHVAIANLEQLIPEPICVITQNVDSLHQRAGSTNVIELHGNLRCCLCSNCNNSYPPGPPQICTICGGDLYFPIVLFEEALNETITKEAFREVNDCSTLYVIGTSLEVLFPAILVAQASFLKKKVIWINTEQPLEPELFSEIHIGKSEVLLPELLT